MGEATFDLGNLLVEDNELFDDSKDSRLERIKKCSQAMFDELSKLASKVVDQVTVVELPEPAFLLPREKHVPKEKNETRWEKYAKLKNIKKKKKPKFAYDEAKGKYMPTWGKGSKDKPWLMEVSEREDQNVNKFAQANEYKRRSRDENETRRLKNIGRAVNVTMNSMHTDRKKQAQKTIKIADVSDASMGKFSRQIDPMKLRKEVAKEFTRTAGPTTKAAKGKPKKPLVKKNPMKKKGSRTGKKKN